MTRAKEDLMPGSNPQFSKTTTDFPSPDYPDLSYYSSAIAFKLWRSDLKRRPEARNSICMLHSFPDSNELLSSH
jgi:hypothetical protein